MRRQKSYRLTKQEIILRFLAFHDQAAKYEGQLAKFLNSYMYSNQNPSSEFLAQKKALFIQTVDCIDKIFRGEAAPRLSITLIEALLVGVARNMSSLLAERPSILRSRYEGLVSHREFSENALKEGLSKKPRVIARLNTATRIFSGE